LFPLLKRGNLSVQNFFPEIIVNLLAYCLGVSDNKLFNFCVDCNLIYPFFQEKIVSYSNPMVSDTFEQNALKSQIN